MGENTDFTVLVCLWGLRDLGLLIRGVFAFSVHADIRRLSKTSARKRRLDWEVHAACMVMVPALCSHECGSKGCPISEPAEPLVYLASTWVCRVTGPVPLGVWNQRAELSILFTGNRPVHPWVAYSLGGHSLCSHPNFAEGNGVSKVMVMLQNLNGQEIKGHFQKFVTLCYLYNNIILSNLRKILLFKMFYRHLLCKVFVINIT